MRKKQVAIIWWEDSVMHNTTGQINESEAKQYMPLQCISAGIIANETKDFITLACDNFPRIQKAEIMTFKEEQYRQISSIPKSAIKRIRKYTI